MTGYWLHRIPVFFLLISFLLYGCCIVNYANETLQFYFIGVDFKNNQGTVWQCGWPLLLFTIFFVGCWRYRPQYKPGAPVRFFSYEWAITITQKNVSMINQAFQNLMDAIHCLIQFCGMYYYLQLFVQKLLPMHWILPAALIFLIIVVGIFWFRIYKANHEM